MSPPRSPRITSLPAPPIYNKVNPADAPVITLAVSSRTLPITQLVVGDRVEARYKGKGSKKYPGRISAVAPGVGNAEATFSILYDDNDKESGALSANVWRQ